MSIGRIQLLPKTDQLLPSLPCSTWISVTSSQITWKLQTTTITIKKSLFNYFFKNIILIQLSKPLTYSFIFNEWNPVSFGYKLKTPNESQTFQVCMYRSDFFPIEKCIRIRRVTMKKSCQFTKYHYHISSKSNKPRIPVKLNSGSTHHRQLIFHRSESNRLRLYILSIR